MARLPRLSVPGHPHYIVQRGNNRQAIFCSAKDRQTLLALLGESAARFVVAIHAYVLMDNHFHLLVTPERADSLPRMMQAAGRRYVRYFNDTQGRSGTLWEGRYKSALIQADRHLLACMVYMDLNPVLSGLVAQAQDYPWSSHGHYGGLRADKLVTPHSVVWDLGNTPFARESSYRDLVLAGVSAEQQTALVNSARSGWALGDADFVAGLQQTTSRRLTRSSAGRPAGTKAG
jgi:putative transposase